MAELAVMLINKAPPEADVYFKVKCEERGDVIAVKEDGWQWSQKELDSPFFVILQVDGTKAEFDHLRYSERGDDDVNLMLRFRKRKIDLDEMIADGDNDIDTEAEAKSKLTADGKADKNKKRKKAKVSKTKAYVLSKVKVKDDVPDPAIVGGSPDLGVI